MYDYFRLSARNLLHRKARSFLTLLGVIIGITAVVSMISVGSGMRASLEEQLEELGGDKIYVIPRMAYGSTAGQLEDQDAEAMGKLPGVAFVSPLYSINTAVEFRGEEKSLLTYGIYPGKAESTFQEVSGGYELMKGRWLSRGDKGKVVIGHGIYEDAFSREVNVGSTMRIRGESFKVVGIFQKTGDRERDYTLYTDIDQLRELTGKEEEITMIIARAQEGVDLEEVRLRIESLIENRKGSSENYFVATQKEILERANQVFEVVQVVFGGLAAVSLIVGAIGIANTMLMNVTERVREIGVMKAVGAENFQVMKVFLADAALIGVTGGTIGVALGYGISEAINYAARSYLGEGMLETTVSYELALFGLGFALLVGVIAGIYPAYRASNQDPVRALRG